ncbi:MAG TPA: YqhA family protein, partial [Thermomicrobiales bacterium]|nr:YqhA family protein [Thermomicrobiales bacterium]
MPRLGVALRNLFGTSRFVIALAVAGAFLGSVLLLVVSTLTVIRLAWRQFVEFDADNLTGKHLDHLGVSLIEITDMILLGMVLYIVSLGLYQLFIDPTLAVPGWLRVNDIGDLKRDLINVTVVLLGVSFLGEVVDWDGTTDILSLGAAVALVTVALGLIMWLTPR